jgi:hypothetical protein
MFALRQGQRLRAHAPGGYLSLGGAAASAFTPLRDWQQYTRYNGDTDPLISGLSTCND